MAGVPNMTELIDRRSARNWGDESAAQEYRYYCKLFGDMITRTPCLLRRRELNGKSDFVCQGCSKDTIMNSPRNRLRAQQERS